MKRAAVILLVVVLILSLSGLTVIQAQPIAFVSDPVQNASISSPGSAWSPVYGNSRPQVLRRAQGIMQAAALGGHGVSWSGLSSLMPRLAPPSQPGGTVPGILRSQSNPSFGNPVPIQPEIAAPALAPATAIPPTEVLETGAAPTVAPAAAQTETMSSAPAVIGAFLESGDPQSRLDALKSVWTPSPYVPLSTDQPIDPLLEGLFAGFSSSQPISTSTPPTFPIVLSDHDTGLSITVDADLGVTIIEQTGGVVRDFALFLNLKGEPAAEYRLADGTIDRVSIEGYGLTISPDGQEWIERVGDQTYAYQLTSEGALEYRDETGEVSVFRVYDTGTLTLELPDGSIAAYVPSGLLDDAIAEDFFLYDADGNLIETGDFDQLVEADANLGDDAAISAGDDDESLDDYSSDTSVDDTGDNGESFDDHGSDTSASDTSGEG